MTSRYCVINLQCKLIQRGYCIRSLYQLFFFFCRNTRGHMSQGPEAWTCCRDSSPRLRTLDFMKKSFVAVPTILTPLHVVWNSTSLNLDSWRQGQSDPYFVLHCVHCSYKPSPLQTENEPIKAHYVHPTCLLCSTHEERCPGFMALLHVP